MTIDKNSSDLIASVIFGLWSEMLNVPISYISLKSNFFLLGGDSVLAFKAIGRLNDFFNIELTIQDIFTFPIAKDLTKHINLLVMASQNYDTDSQYMIESVSREKPLPLSFSQQRLWVLYNIEGPSSTYNILHALKLKGNLDKNALVHSLQEIYCRHEILRTRIIVKDGIPSQHIDNPNLFKIEEGVYDSDKQLHEICKKEKANQINLTHDNLFRIRLLSRSINEYALIIYMHHAISDGWSWAIFTKELTSLYQCFVDNRDSSLPTIDIQFADYAVWEINSFKRGRFDSQITYWKNKLEGAPTLIKLPIDNPRSPLKEFNGAEVPYEIQSHTLNKLRLLCKNNGTTLFISLLSIFSIILCRYTAQFDFIIGTPVANRTHKEIEGLMGLFVNTLAMRIDLTKELSFTELLEQIKESSVESYNNQELPFDYLVEMINPERNLCYTPLVQVAFNLLNLGDYEVKLKDVSVSRIYSANTTSKFDLTLKLIEKNESIVGVFEYNNVLFKQETIRDMSNLFDLLLKEIISEPDQLISHYCSASKLVGNGFLDRLEDI